MERGSRKGEILLYLRLKGEPNIEKRSLYLDMREAEDFRCYHLLPKLG